MDNARAPEKPQTVMGLYLCPKKGILNASL
jgi:hypothetical protein